MYYYYCHLFELERAILLRSNYAVVIVFEKKTKQKYSPPSNKGHVMNK